MSTAEKRRGIGIVNNESRQPRPSLTGSLALIAAASIVSVAGCDRGEKKPEVEMVPIHPPNQQQPSQAAANNAYQGQNPATRTPTPPVDRASAAGAQKDQPGSGTLDPEGTPAQVRSEELDRFAKAYTKVQAVNEKYGPRISNAADPDQARAIQQQAAQRMAQVVQEEELSVAKYSELAERINRDDELRGRLEKRITN